VKGSGAGAGREDARASSPDRAARTLTLVGVGLAALFLAGALLPRHPDLDALFGAESFRTSLFAYALATALVFWILRVPGVAGRLADFAAGLGTRVPYPRLTVPIAAGFVFFFVLTSQRLSGDGATCIWCAAGGLVYPSNALTSYLHQGFAALPGLSLRDAVRLTDAVAGAVYVFAALGIARECFEDGARRTALGALLLTTGSVALFFGSIEVYAPLAAGIAVYLLVGVRFLNGRGSGLLPPLVLGVTFTLHGSAGLLLPSLLLLANEGRFRPFRVRRWLVWGGLFLIPVALVFGALWFLTWEGNPPQGQAWRVGSFLGAMGQGPIPPLVRSTANLTHRYALLDLEHLLGALNLWFLAAPLGLGLLAVGWRGRRRTPRIAWVASAVAFLAAYPVFWNVSYSLRRDWDLFSSLGAPLALLAGLVFLGAARGRRVAVGVVVLSVYAFAPFLVANTGRTIDRVRYAASMADAYRTAAAHTTGAVREKAEREQRAWTDEAARLNVLGASVLQAARLAARGEADEAERILERVLDQDPEEVGALMQYGMLLVRTGRRDEGRRLLERAVRGAPENYWVRYELARTYRDEGRFDLAIPLLEKAVRYSTAETPKILKGLAELEAYWRGPGRDPARADLMKRLADERRGPPR